MRLTTVLALCLVLAAGCGSTSASRPKDVPKPDVEIRRIGDMFFGSGRTAPLTLEVAISNPAPRALIVRRIRVEAPGMVQYGIQPTERILRETLQPGEAKTIAITATAVAGSSRRDFTEPLNLRAWIDFEIDGMRFRELYLLR
ncbi:MAG: hypothetical protein ABIO78_07845 [Thermoanaerobaculia bacterium]